MKIISGMLIIACWVWYKFLLLWSVLKYIPLTYVSVIDVFILFGVIFGWTLSAIIEAYWFVRLNKRE